jgi:hypothetical protein
MTKCGKNVGLYLSEEIYGYIARDARARGIPVTTWVRNVVLAACPPDVRSEQAGAKQPAKRLKPAPRKKPQDTAARLHAGKQEPGSFVALVERHRDRVLDLEARGHLPNAICSITRLEYKVVAEILATRAMRKETRR